MGFGLLLAGYFLLLDVAYFLITDIIAAALIALALSKLSYLNRGFKAALITSFVFLAFSVVEFGFGAYEMLSSPIKDATLISGIAILKNVILCTLSLTMFEGMREVSDEVGLASHAKKCRTAAYLALPIYTLAIVAETPSLFDWTTPYVATIIGVTSMLATLAYLIFTLTAIFGCYAKICMPEEKNMSSVTKNKEKKSESFADAYRRQREERQATKAQRKKSQ
jgi:hypothetical protein